MEKEVLSLTDSTINVKSTSETTKLLQGNCTQTTLPSKDYAMDNEYGMPMSSTESTVPILDKIKQLFSEFSRKINLKALLAPSAIAAAAGFFIGLVSPLRKLMIGATVPLRAIEDSALLLGEAAIPTMTLIVGGNLLKGLKGSGLPVSIIIVPLSGILIVKGGDSFWPGALGSAVPVCSSCAVCTSTSNEHRYNYPIVWSRADRMFCYIALDIFSGFSFTDSMVNSLHAASSLICTLVAQ